jgi:hypothetical protein
MADEIYSFRQLDELGVEEQGAKIVGRGQKR